MILVSGASGQLGFELKKILGSRAIYLERSQLDLSKPNDIKSALRNYKFETFINAAAYTQVDLAEKERDQAFKINAEAPKVLAEYSNEMGFKLIHFSTDYVFDGEKIGAYREDDKKNPQCVYGESKAIGEEAVLDAAPGSLVVRTSWVYSEHGKNFVKTILKAGMERNELKVVDDQMGTLTWAKDLALVIEKSLEKNISGIYHFSGEGKSSWYDIAIKLKELSRFNAVVHAVPTSGYPTLAKRPTNSLLDKTKIKKDLNLSIDEWEQTLTHFYGSLYG